MKGSRYNPIFYLPEALSLVSMALLTRASVNPILRTLRTTGKAMAAVTILISKPVKDITCKSPCKSKRNVKNREKVAKIQRNVRKCLRIFTTFIWLVLQTKQYYRKLRSLTLSVYDFRVHLFLLRIHLRTVKNYGNDLVTYCYYAVFAVFKSLLLHCVLLSSSCRIVVPCRFHRFDMSSMTL